MPLRHLRLELELDDGDGLVHLRREALRAVIHQHLVARHARLELLAGVVAVGVEGESGQWDEVDAVTLLQGGQVGVTQRQPDDIADAGLVAGTGSHP